MRELIEQANWLPTPDSGSISICEHMLWKHTLGIILNVLVIGGLLIWLLHWGIREGGITNCVRTASPDRLLGAGSSRN
jgi:hypothetical protein